MKGQQTFMLTCISCSLTKFWFFFPGAVEEMLKRTEVSTSISLWLPIWPSPFLPNSSNLYCSSAFVLCHLQHLHSFGIRLSHKKIECGQCPWNSFLLLHATTMYTCTCTYIYTCTCMYMYPVSAFSRVV